MGFGRKRMAIEFRDNVGDDDDEMFFSGDAGRAPDRRNRRLSGTSYLSAFVDRLLLIRFRLVIFHLGVERPDITLIHAAFDDVIDGRHGGQHRVVLVVVLVHAVAAH